MGKTEKGKASTTDKSEQYCSAVYFTNTHKIESDFCKLPKSNRTNLSYYQAQHGTPLQRNETAVKRESTKFKLGSLWAAIELNVCSSQFAK